MIIGLAIPDSSSSPIESAVSGLANPTPHADAQFAKYLSQATVDDKEPSTPREFRQISTLQQRRLLDRNINSFKSGYVGPRETRTNLPVNGATPQAARKERSRDPVGFDHSQDSEGKPETTGLSGDQRNRTGQVSRSTSGAKETDNESESLQSNDTGQEEHIRPQDKGNAELTNRLESQAPQDGAPSIGEEKHLSTEPKLGDSISPVLHLTGGGSLEGNAQLSAESQASTPTADLAFATISAGFENHELQATSKSLVAYHNTNPLGRRAALAGGHQTPSALAGYERANLAGGGGHPEEAPAQLQHPEWPNETPDPGLTAVLKTSHSTNNVPVPKEANLNVNLRFDPAASRAFRADLAPPITPQSMIASLANQNIARVGMRLEQPQVNQFRIEVPSPIGTGQLLSKEASEETLNKHTEESAGVTVSDAVADFSLDSGATLEQSFDQQTGGGQDGRSTPDSETGQQRQREESLPITGENLAVDLQHTLNLRQSVESTEVAYPESLGVGAVADAKPVLQSLETHESASGGNAPLAKAEEAARAASLHSGFETAQQKPIPSAVTQLRIEIPIPGMNGGADEKLQLHFNQKSSALQLGIQATQNDLQMELRDALPDLLGKLRTSGWQQEPTPDGKVGAQIARISTNLGQQGWDFKTSGSQETMEFMRQPRVFGVVAQDGKVAGQMLDPGQNSSLNHGRHEGQQEAPFYGRNQEQESNQAAAHGRTPDNPRNRDAENGTKQGESQDTAQRQRDSRRDRRGRQQIWNRSWDGINTNIERTAS